MAKARNDDTLVPSVLDRLIDEEPSVSVEAPRNDFQVVRGLKQSLRRDVENLLNTRWRCVGWPEEWTELDVSLVNYGIPDFTGGHMGTAGSREDFIGIIQEAVRRFEPRLRRVKVEILDNIEREDRTMRFRIDAVLMVDPEPIPVVFDSALEPTSGTFRVVGGGNE